jgi:mRNA interferase MazF
MATRLSLCQITSRTVPDRYAVPLDDGDFADGGLHQPSHARPNRLFAADRAILLYRAGRLRQDKMDEIMDRLVEIVRS